jgi:hypothetical protein
MDWTMEQLERWIDLKAVDPSGTKIGTIADVYVDDASGEPEWLAVMTGLFGTRISFVPLAGASEEDGVVKVAHDKAVVKDSPNIEVDGELDESDEARLYGHYKLDLPAQSAESGSVSIIDDSPEIARGRLRRRDEAAVRAMGLSDDDLS